MTSGVRVILRNERYRGLVHWNTSEWRKDPDTGRRKRVARPRPEWITYADETQRIVPQAVWESVHARINQSAKLGHWDAPRGRAAKYLLSGLLRCAQCGAHYVIVDQRNYGCSSHAHGHACPNSIRVGRESLERDLLDPVREELTEPDRLERTAARMQAYYDERRQEFRNAAAEAPRALQELDARITRLRERLISGDPDLPPDELQAAIERAETKRQELLAREPHTRQAAKIRSILPRAADLCLRQINDGLDGDPRAALKARVFLRSRFGGRIDLRPEGSGELWAEWDDQPEAIVKHVLVNSSTCNCGSGGRI